MVCAAKETKELYFNFDIITLDEKVNFGGMEGSKIDCLGFGCSGGSDYSNWNAHPMRFENLVASIAESEGLKNSLKTLNIFDCQITQAKAQDVLNKYNLKSVTLDGY